MGPGWPLNAPSALRGRSPKDGQVGSATERGEQWGQKHHKYSVLTNLGILLRISCILKLPVPCSVAPQASPPIVIDIVQ